MTAATAPTRTNSHVGLQSRVVSAGSTLGLHSFPPGASPRRQLTSRKSSDFDLGNEFLRGLTELHLEFQPLA